ncbi:major facilitator superfamily domain-containing protein [Xylogone sp. PMI_703]|nr:major facilitator superfamily domain-containing protein [Xylogone sp. PMI_703]
MADKNDNKEHLEFGNEEKNTETRSSPELGPKSENGLRTLDAGLSPDEVITDDQISEQEGKRILRKVDFRLIPLLSVLYLIAYVDRSNIGNAKIAGMSDDLNLYGMRYNTALTVFFVPYSIFEVPSNIVLKVLRPSIWISLLCLAWGTVMTLMGLVNSYQGLVIARFFLGVAEAGFFPAATYLLTIWYKRYEVQQRMAIFYAAASLSGAFSGLLAFAIEHMDGISGLGGWKWIFILEGLVPVAVSFSLYFLLPDKPETAKFLTPQEREWIVNRIALQTGSGHGRVTNADKIRTHHIKSAFADWRIWLGIIPFWGCTIGTYGFTATVPTVLLEMGYSSTNAQLLTVPIYVFGLLATVVAAFWSDRVQQRTPFIMGGFAIAVVGFIGELAIPHPRLSGVTYFFLFLIAAGLYSPFVCIVTLIGNNLAPSSKRAVGMALLSSIGNMGGICGSNIYFSKEAPRYPAGFGTSLGISVASIIAAYALRVIYRKENKRRDELMAREGEEGIRAQYTEQELLELGDLSPFYRYTL